MGSVTLDSGMGFAPIIEKGDDGMRRCDKSGFDQTFAVSVPSSTNSIDCANVSGPDFIVTTLGSGSLLGSGPDNSNMIVAPIAEKVDDGVRHDQSDFDQVVVASIPSSTNSFNCAGMSDPDSIGILCSDTECSVESDAHLSSFIF